ncbi:hypothetical protein [Sporolactobacillus pectinivorans]|uniref:hypothetical protein n=1 Tax=Sporolactobacillus pectinivorans TaxID=1591408 RepID=UPI000C2686B2|nr:hypothetical protein [Sporolactobacillus pectinivorans]
MRSRIYYDTDHEGHLFPLWYAIEGTIDWNDSKLFFFVGAPFERIGSIDFDDGRIGCSVHAGEMMINKEMPEQIGINLKAVKCRISQFIEPEKIERLIFQISDIEEILQIGKERFVWI